MTSLAAEGAAAAWSQVEARVAAHRPYGQDHLWLDLEVPRSFARPAPGQFVQILLRSPAPVLLPRPMSVASVRERGGRLVLGFLYGPVGAGTIALSRQRVGDAVQVLGPLGRGYPLETAGTPVLVAGGRGVAPLLFAAQALARAGRRCEFFFGARTKAALVGLDEARRRLERVGGRLHLATDDGSRGRRGTVVELLERAAGRLPPPLAIHACGPHAMLEAVARWAMRRGSPSFLAMESVMACGTGVCRGCPMPRSVEAARRTRATRGDSPSLLGNADYAMCCTEGPVFRAEDLDWDRVD
ncbi:MAG: dihydroorotate dehydrogenase electron transfer subunit [Candidatus Eisenbacteria bacterium]|uniref:Dihydroorotate dehydrogenase electron transfer subunit n=1 Tax=Eiseniibacteriota bacterium TaxID=2212470 RepID=A0A538U9E4_UNCEI|nr:MAG: dihydroorotate dehydrogenase electron transfer subunit [Candidatus Eisenbacteria bacterium]